MKLNTEKYKYIAHTLIKHGWHVYQQPTSTVLTWVDPQHCKNHYRLKDAYTKLIERQGWDGQDG